MNWHTMVDVGVGVYVLLVVATFIGAGVFIADIIRKEP